ncbi:MAG: peptidase MA family metallohydrolase [Nitrospira sp.]|nr:peptidase MA family metallohydrolase [Nitrospira sp.]
MYRRNISHILYAVAGIIGLFIVYHTVLKSDDSSVPLSNDAESDANRPQPAQPDSQTNGLQETALKPEPRQTRLIDSSAVPDTSHHELLETIRDDIEKGNNKEAETKLADLPTAVVADKTLRPYLAILWNNLGIQQEKEGGTVISVKAFKKASTLDAENPVIYMNLAHAYWELRDPAMTQDFLEKLAALAQNEPFPHLALAELFQERNRLDEAARHLDQAIARAGNDPTVQTYLRTVTAKVRRTETSDALLTSRDSTHFTVKFDGEADQATWAVVLEILEEAYREIGQKFGYFPSKTIVVVLHTKSQFQNATGSPAWADGLFDPVLGRIQVPAQNAVTDRAWLTRVLRHEYVHALLHDQQGPANNAIPTWFNEGLAMELSGEHWPEFDQIIQGEFTLIPLSALEGSWGALPAEAATVAYMEAQSAMHYMIDRYSMHQVRELLTHLKARQTLAAAIQSQLSLSYEQFQARWVEQLEEQRKRKEKSP